MEMEELQVIGELEPKLGQISNRSGSDSGMEIVEEVEVTNNKMSNSDSDSQRKNGVTDSKKSKKKKLPSRKQRDETMKKITSETQRLRREQEFFIPCHKPQQLTLEQFLQRRKPKLSENSSNLKATVQEDVSKKSSGTESDDCLFLDKTPRVQLKKIDEDINIHATISDNEIAGPSSAIIFPSLQEEILRGENEPIPGPSSQAIIRIPTIEPDFADILEPAPGPSAKTSSIRLDQKQNSVEFLESIAGPSMKVTMLPEIEKNSVEIFSEDHDDDDLLFIDTEAHLLEKPINETTSEVKANDIPKKKNLRDLLQSLKTYKKITETKPVLGKDGNENFIDLTLDNDSSKTPKKRESKKASNSRIDKLMDRFLKHAIVPQKPTEEHFNVHISKKVEDSQGVEHDVVESVDFIAHNDSQEISFSSPARTNNSPVGTKQTPPGSQLQSLRERLQAQIREKKKKEYEEKVKLHAIYNEEKCAEDKEEEVLEDDEFSSTEGESEPEETDEEAMQEYLNERKKKKKGKKLEFADEEAEVEDDGFDYMEDDDDEEENSEIEADVDQKATDVELPQAENNEEMVRLTSDDEVEQEDFVASKRKTKVLHISDDDDDSDNEKGEVDTVEKIQSDEEVDQILKTVNGFSPFVPLTPQTPQKPSDDLLGLCSGEFLAQPEDESDEFGDDVGEEIDSDNEEVEAPVKFKSFKTKSGKIRREFVEDEAELSGSEVNSSDEDERGLDDDDLELVNNEEVIDEEEARAQNERQHLRQMIDDDEREVRLLQDMLLEDGDLHDGKNRERQFKWKYLSTVEDEEDAMDGHDPTAEDENEVKLQQDKLEKIKWMKENSDTLTNDDNETSLASIMKGSSQLSKRTLRKVQSFVSFSQESSNILDESSSSSKVKNLMSFSSPLDASEDFGITSMMFPELNGTVSQTTSELSSSVAKSVNSQRKLKGSFFKLESPMLNKLAELHKPRDLNGSKGNSRNFVFSVQSPPTSSANAAEEHKNKRKAKCPTKFQSKKKLKLGDSGGSPKQEFRSVFNWINANC